LFFCREKEYTGAQEQELRDGLIRECGIDGGGRSKIFETISFFASGLLHIHVDKQMSGVVFVKCDSAATAFNVRQRVRDTQTSGEGGATFFGRRQVFL
jgi:hypothetical protein